jgi:hypothetical protein
MSRGGLVAGAGWWPGGLAADACWRPGPASVKYASQECYPRFARTKGGAAVKRPCASSWMAVQQERKGSDSTRRGFGIADTTTTIGI